MIDKLLEIPFVYDLSQKVLSLIAFGNKGIARTIQKYLPDRGKILDVGCGTGRYAALFTTDYLGTDINPKYIERANKEACSPKTKFSVGDATNIESPGESFDGVFAMGLLHHLTDTQARRTAEEMMRVCKKGGRVLIVDPVITHPLNLPGRILFGLDRGANRRSFEKLEELLKPLGFKTVEPSVPNSFPYRVSAFLKEL